MGNQESVPTNHNTVIKKKRKPTNIILDNSSNIYKTNIKKQDNVCLIRLDENGNII